MGQSTCFLPFCADRHLQEIKEDTRDWKLIHKDLIALPEEAQKKEGLF